MRAVVKFKKGPGNIKIMEIDEPKTGPGQIKIQIKFAGICGTDLHIRKEEFWSNPPVVLGHECCGIITEVGKDVTGFKIGDKVTTETAAVVCGRCEFCMSGNYLMCSDRLSIGYGVDGGFTEYIVVRQEIVHRIPDNVTMKEAALSEPTAVAYHAVFDYSNIRPDQTVVVFGPGTIGQLVAQMILSMGARVILCGTSKDLMRLKVAENLGSEILVTDKIDVAKYVMDATDGSGADYVFDCSGAAQAITQGINCLKKQGTLVQVGLTATSITLDYGAIPMKEISIRGAFGHINSSWRGALKMMDRKQINVGPLISRELKLEDWEEAFDLAEDLDAIKVLLHP